MPFMQHVEIKLQNQYWTFSLTFLSFVLFCFARPMRLLASNYKLSLSNTVILRTDTCMEMHLAFQVSIALDQPVTALNLFKQGLEKFPGEVTLLCGIARIYEVTFILFFKVDVKQRLNATKKARGLLRFQQKKQFTKLFLLAFWCVCGI